MCECEVICPFRGKCKLMNTISCETCGNNSGGGNYYKPRFPSPDIIPVTTPWYPTIFPWTPWHPFDPIYPLPDGTARPFEYPCYIISVSTRTLSSKDTLQKPDN